MPTTGILNSLGQLVSLVGCVLHLVAEDPISIGQLYALSPSVRAIPGRAGRLEAYRKACIAVPVSIIAAENIAFCSLFHITINIARARIRTLRVPRAPRLIDVGRIPCPVVDRRRACPEHEAAVRACVATRAAVARREERYRLRTPTSRSAPGLPGRLAAVEFTGGTWRQPDVMAFEAFVSARLP
jgi:hypothetical protein